MWGWRGRLWLETGYQLAMAAELAAAMPANGGN